jgi:16S rRNA processing protein RimM
VGRICVAQIGGAHGLGGEVKLKALTADPLAVKDYSPLESEDGATRFVIEGVRPGKDHLIARLRGIHDRDAAERLAGVKLFVPRSSLPPPEAGEFYYADLIGLRALTVDGVEVGSVVAVHDFGAGDILELRLAQGDATMMLPFTETCVPEVDLAQGRIVVAPPEQI